MSSRLVGSRVHVSIVVIVVIGYFDVRGGGGEVVVVLVVVIVRVRAVVVVDIVHRDGSGRATHRCHHHHRECEGSGNGTNRCRCHLCVHPCGTRTRDPRGLATPMTKPRPGRRQRARRHVVDIDFDAREEKSTVHTLAHDRAAVPTSLYPRADWHTHQSTYARWPGKWSASNHASH